MNDSNMKNKEESHSEDLDDLIDVIKIEVKEHVFHWYTFYKHQADKSRFLFRSSGLLVILASTSIPVLSVLEFPFKNYIVAILGLCIALMTGLNSFYRWEARWSTYRQSQFSVDQLLSIWRLAILDAKHIEDKNIAKQKVLGSTKQLFEEVKKVREIESKTYFENVQWPQNEKISNKTHLKED